MSAAVQNQLTRAHLPDSRWKDLYRIGYLACLVLVASIVLAIIAFFLWPYKPGLTSIGDIFAVLQNDRLGGMVSLDLPALILVVMMIFPIVALYVALKSVNESYALIALVLGLMGVVLYLLARPLFEMAYLSDQHAVALSDAAKSQYLAAGESFHALFKGTSWTLALFMMGISSTVSCLLMLRSKAFSRTTALLGVITAILGTSIFIPMIGDFLNFFGTVGSVMWYILMARDFYRLGWGQPKSLQAAFS